jgi:hypothetical protein
LLVGTHCAQKRQDADERRHCKEEREPHVKKDGSGAVSSAFIREIRVHLRPPFNDREPVSA